MSNELSRDAREVLEAVEFFVGVIEKFDRTGMMDRYPCDFISGAGGNLRDLQRCVEDAQSSDADDAVKLGRAVLADYSSLLLDDQTQASLERRFPRVREAVVTGRNQRPAMIQRITELLSRANGSPKQSAGSTGPTIRTHRESRFLEALYALGAFDQTTRCTTDAAVSEISENADANSYKHTCTDLYRKGLVNTQDGRGGGAWLTQAGREAVEQTACAPSSKKRTV